MADLAKIVLMQSPSDRQDALEKALRDLVTLTRREEGCVQCVLHASSDDRTRFMVYEVWADAPAFDRHMATAHVADFLAQADTLLATPADVAPFDVLS